MPGYNWDFSVVREHTDVLLSAVRTTVALASISCFAGTVLGLCLAVLLVQRHRSMRLLARIVLEVGRGIPLLVLLVWFHYVAPVLVGVTTSAFWNAVMAFSISLGAFLADIFRGAVESIPRGHVEAAESLGLTRWLVLRRVLLPETVRRSFSAVLAMYIGTLKLSTLAAVIGVHETFYAIRVLNTRVARPFELYTVLALIFLTGVLGLSAFATFLEKRSWFSLYPKSSR